MKPPTITPPTPLPRELETVCRTLDPVLWAKTALDTLPEELEPWFQLDQEDRDAQYQRPETRGERLVWSISYKAARKYLLEALPPIVIRQLHLAGLDLQGHAMYDLLETATAIRDFMETVKVSPSSPSNPSNPYNLLALECSAKSSPTFNLDL
jgi:hypothetical protein